MIRNIEVNNGVVIQKITRSDGSLIRYQTVAQSSLGDSMAVKTWDTLAAARAEAGWKPNLNTLPESLTKPRSAYVQNNKGYRADNQRRA